VAAVVAGNNIFLGGCKKVKKHCNFPKRFPKITAEVLIVDTVDERYCEIKALCLFKY